MAFELPALPYAYDALGPYMSAETLEYHHDKHHQAYVTNANKLLDGSGLEGKSLEDVVKESFGKNAGLFNNAAQNFNHLYISGSGWPRTVAAPSLPGKLQTDDRQLTSVAMTSSRRISSPPAPVSLVPAGPGWLSRTASSK